MTPTAADALAGLRDIHLPEPIGLWPPAPGWWLLFGLLVTSGLGLCLYLRARQRSLAHAALRELDDIARGYREHDDLGELARALSALLRRVAIARHPRAEVARLEGESWSRFLLDTDRRGGLTPRMLGDLDAAVYAGPRVPDLASDVETWIDGARRWIGANT